MFTGTCNRCRAYDSPGLPPGCNHLPPPERSAHRGRDPLRRHPKSLWSQRSTASLATCIKDSAERVWPPFARYRIVSSLQSHLRFRYPRLAQATRTEPTNRRRSAPAKPPYRRQAHSGAAPKLIAAFDVGNIAQANLRPETVARGCRRATAKAACACQPKKIKATAARPLSQVAPF